MPIDNQVSYLNEKHIAKDMNFILQFVFSTVSLPSVLGLTVLSRD